MANIQTLAEAYGFRNLSFKNSNAKPVINLYILMYQNKLYQVVLRYKKASRNEQQKIFKDLKNKFNEPELNLSDSGVKIYSWMTLQSLILCSLSENDDPIFNMTRVAYTDLITKRKLGPGYP